jgi:hypothetical protein
MIVFATQNLNTGTRLISDPEDGPGGAHLSTALMGGVTALVFAGCDRRRSARSMKSFVGFLD